MGRLLVHGDMVGSGVVSRVAGLGVGGLGLAGDVDGGLGRLSVL